MLLQYCGENHLIKAHSLLGPHSLESSKSSDCYFRLWPDITPACCLSLFPDRQPPSRKLRSVITYQPTSRLDTRVWPFLMASVKVVSLLIKTLSKPIANRLKTSAQDHPTFRKVCVGLAQSLHRYETRLASGIFSKVQPPIRPLSDAKAIQNGANFLSEAFLFSVAATLIIAENLRVRFQTAHRRDVVNDRLTELETLCADISAEQERWADKLELLILHYEHQKLSQDKSHGSRNLQNSHLPSENDLVFNETQLNPQFAQDDQARPTKVAMGKRLV
ncbi:hypothetical protein O181_015345 [Austropuccinia psidii MF-1]|uniref:Optic atrophy 3 protein n=1 Tax=Austropuccinia psidii MF-1 TaxID=1389203 RepID=A0A9Q3GQV5_9BASI|nr:hypothetical protein [Austropuccinia psidii MF-1]